MLMGLFLRLFRQEIVVGDLEDSDSWRFLKAQAYRGRYDAFEWGRIFSPSHGGWRLTLFRWLQAVDPNTGLAYYQPLIWIERAPAHQSEEHGWQQATLFLYITVPPHRGQLEVRFPLSRAAYKEFGLVRTDWEAWHTSQPASEGNDRD